MELVGYEDVEARSHEALASLVVHAIGNGWTVDVIAHILKFLPKEYTNEN